MRCGTVPLRQAQGEKAHRRLSLLCWHSVQAEQGQPPGFRNGAGGAGKSVLPAGLCRFVGMPARLGRKMQCAAMAHAARCAGRCSTLHRASHRSALSGAKGWGGWCTGIPPSPAHSPVGLKKGADGVKCGCDVHPLPPKVRTFACRKPPEANCPIHIIYMQIMEKQNVIISQDLEQSLTQALERQSFDRLFVLTDTTTHRLCRPLLAGMKCLDGAVDIVVKPTDEHKNIRSLVSVWTALQQGGATRHSLMVNLGGGMVTDLGGFATSTFKRGIPYINVPTTPPAWWMPVWAARRASTSAV